MKTQNKILIFGKSFTLSFLVFIASIGANLMLFCILATARTTPTLKYIETPESRHVMSLDMSSSMAPEQVEKKMITDIVQLNTSTTDTELPEPVLETIFSLEPTLSIEDVIFELPGLPVLSSTLSLQIPADDVSTDNAIRTMSISQVDVLPSKISGPLPQYPGWAQRDKLEGTVTLRFIVNEEGNVKEINIHEIKGDERFGVEAIQAVSKWHFNPAIKAGKPVSCWCFQKINFKVTF